MKRYRDRNDAAVVKTLKEGGIGVLRTDTIYGIVAAARSHAAVERVYEVRHRSAHKRCIILVASQHQLLSAVPDYALQATQHYWPGKVSIELPVDENVPEWLHRGAREISYRMPADKELRQLLEKTGPLIAPSANPEGLPPALSIASAERYFGDSVDFYVDSGACDANTSPSMLLRVRSDGSVERLR